MSRISGIVGGTLISLLLAVTVYPSSATQELLQDLKEALRGLTELNKSAVREAAHALGHATQQGEEGCVQACLMLACLWPPQTCAKKHRHALQWLAGISFCLAFDFVRESIWSCR